MSIQTKIDSKSAEEIKSILLSPDENGYAEFAHSFENKDQLIILRQTSEYYGYKKGDELVVMYGDYVPSYLEDGKDGWLVCCSERWSVDNIDAAIHAFEYRLDSGYPFQNTGLGQRYEEIFQKIKER